MDLERFIMGGVQIARAILSLDFSNQIDRVRIDQALQSLRQIFFFPSELQNSLKAIADGKSVKEEMAAYFIQRFRVVPNDIGATLEYLERARFESSRRVLLVDTQLMTAIRHDKIDVRQQISRLFQNYIDARCERNQAEEVKIEAARIMAQIDTLNSSIQECEAKLLAVRDAPHTAIASRTSTAIKKAVTPKRKKR